MFATQWPHLEVLHKQLPLPLLHPTLRLCLLPTAQKSQESALAPEALLAGLATSGGSAQDTVVFFVSWPSESLLHYRVTSLLEKVYPRGKRYNRSKLYGFLFLIVLFCFNAISSVWSWTLNGEFHTRSWVKRFDEEHRSTIGLESMYAHVFPENLLV